MIIKGYELDRRSDKFPTDAQIRAEGMKWGLPLHRLKSELSSLAWQEERAVADYMESIRGRGVTVGGAQPHINGIRRIYALKKLEAEDPKKIDEGWSDDMKLALCAKRELLIKKDGRKVPATNFWDFESGMPQFIRQSKIEQDKKKDVMRIVEKNTFNQGSKPKSNLSKVVGVSVAVILALGGPAYYLFYSNVDISGDYNIVIIQQKQ